MTLLSQLPQPDKRNIAIHIKPAAERALRDEHPWLYENSIRSQSKEGQAGDIAVIFDNKDRFLAVGLYDPTSPIRVKVLHHNSPNRINAEFFQQKIQTAYERRTPLHDTDTNGYRLVYGEGDGLAGLIIDRYADVLVIKIYTPAWFAHLQHIVDSLNQILPDSTIILRLSRLVSEGATYGLQDGSIIQGELNNSSVRFREHGLTFSADVVEGHKTGFFFDQRENRLRVRGLAEGKSVLDVFSYNGGFSVNAAVGGATSVTSLDISLPALADAKQNMRLNSDKINQVDHHTIVADAFEGLQNLIVDKRQYDMVIVDPPTFASSQGQVDGALKAYKNLVELALELVAPDGVLVMASCSSRVSADAFFALVHNTAIRAGRPLQEIDRTQHALDHPVTFPEGAYLKCLFSTVP